jgi:integrase
MRTKAAERFSGGFRTAAEAASARREIVVKASAGLIKPSRAGLTVSELLDQYLDGIDADRKLSAKTCHDYRVFADVYIRPYLGAHRVRDVTSEVIVAWQRKLLKEDGHRKGRPLSANTIRLARAPLAGAFKLAIASGLVAVNPLSAAGRPTPPRSVPKGWTPNQARKFLSLTEGERTYPIWAFLMGSGLRIGELVALRWPNVDLDEDVVRVVEFTTYIGHELAPSSGKSPDAVRRVDIDDGIAGVLRLQQEVQERDRASAVSYEPSEFVFTVELVDSFRRADQCTAKLARCRGPLTGLALIPWFPDRGEPSVARPRYVGACRYSAEN